MTWENTVAECPLCEMNKQTEWHTETADFVVAEKLGGGPFVVLKNHEQEPEQETVERAHDVVSALFGSHTFQVLMGIVEDHWHAHIITEERSQHASEE